MVTQQWFLSQPELRTKIWVKLVESVNFIEKSNLCFQLVSFLANCLYQLHFHRQVGHATRQIHEIFVWFSRKFLQFEPGFHTKLHGPHWLLRVLRKLIILRKFFSYRLFFVRPSYFVTNLPKIWRLILSDLQRFKQIVLEFKSYNTCVLNFRAMCKCDKLIRCILG